MRSIPAFFVLLLALVLLLLLAPCGWACPITASAYCAPQYVAPAQYAAPAVAQVQVQSYAPAVNFSAYSAQLGYSAPALGFSGGYGGGYSLGFGYGGHAQAFTGGYGHGYGVRQRAFAVRGFHGGFGGQQIVAGRGSIVIRNRGLGLFNRRAPAVIIRSRR